jgi:DNA-binding IscR family transcriptional regulator
MESLNNVSLAEFIEMIEGRLAWTDCSRGQTDCKCDMLDSCNIIEPMHQFNRRLIEFLKSITLADLLQLNGNLIDISLTPTDGNGTARQPQ